MKLPFLALVALSLFIVLMIPRPTEAAPGGVTLAQACRGDGMVDVGFRWSGVNAATRAMFLDVSFVDNGWKKGTFSGVGPMDNSTTGTSAGGFIPNKDYFIRLNQQLTNGAWEPSSTYKFAVIDCTDPHNRTTNAGSTKKPTKPAPDPLSIPESSSTPSKGDTGSSSSSSSSNNGNNNSTPTPTNQTDSTPPATPADSGSATQCADGATVYGGGALACANHGGAAR